MSLPIVEVEEGKTHAYECELYETLAMAITRMVEQ